MTRQEKYVLWLRKEYPEIMSKEQFYKAAHIAKSTARWLLETHLVPCIDTGKKTHRFIIKTEDVIAYLKDREVHPRKYEPAFRRGRRPGYANKDTFISMSAERRKCLRRHFEDHLKNCPDLITVIDAARALGYSQSAVVKWCSTGKLKAIFASGKYHIPKARLVDYLMSDEAMCIRQKSFRHELLLQEFLDR